MSNQELLEYMDFFRVKSEQGKLVIFVGAGVSCNVKNMPDWSSLIQNMAEAIEYSKCTSCKHRKEDCERTCLLKNDFSSDEFLKIPQYLFNRDPKLYNKILSDSIICDENCDAPLSSAIFDINPVHIITTNYDKLLESSKNVFCEQYQVIVNDKDLLNADKGKYIIKMHGDISLPESIVLKEQDYLDYSQNHVLIELFIKSLLTDHIVLFLGYSLNDYNIKLIISWLNYMRTQNGALNNDYKVGYIVLDVEKIDDMQRSYFSSNNIGVININEIKPIQDIPASLASEKGRRLYSFLRVIADPALEKSMLSIEKAVQLMSSHSFISYEHILKLLYVKSYNVIDGNLELRFKDDYVRLTSFMKADTEDANKLKQLFINAGIVSILCDTGKIEEFPIGKFSENSLLKDDLYNYYLLNKYDQIKLLLDGDSCDLFPTKKYFYQSIVDGYEKIIKEYEYVDMSQLNMDQKVAYLHNCSVVGFLKKFLFDSSKVKHFIKNISFFKERQLFDDYLDMYSGNTKKHLKMKTELENLKNDIFKRDKIRVGSTSCGRIYEIKNLAMTEYLFYYNNHILNQGLSDLIVFFKPYIEAIICSNNDAAAEPRYFFDVKIENEKYFIECIDFDIITKFSTIKELNVLINKYNVKVLNTGEYEVSFLVECFKNLCHSLVAARTYGFNQASFKTLSNIILLLNLVTLTDNDKKILAISIGELFSDKIISQTIFSVGWPEYKQTLIAFSKLCSSLTLERDFEVVKRILTNESFFEFANNVNFNSLRNLIASLLPNDDDSISIQIQKIIDFADNLNQKVTLLRLFYKNLKDDTIQKKYQNLLSENFSILPTHAIYDFVFSGWFIPTPKTVKEFLNGIVKLNKERICGVRQYPDPVETKMECVYLMYINDMIEDISVLKELSEGRPHLQFLLDQETFDYTQVDFSNYMWANFARKPKYMKVFVDHKDEIVPLIKERIEQKNISKDEEKILSVFLLDKSEIWSI